jgi:hypothetical protein
MIAAVAKGRRRARTHDVIYVYAAYGLAMVAAQALETDLVTAMLISLMPRFAAGEITSDDVAGFRNSRYEMTFGRLISELERHISVTDDLRSALAAALKARNRLAHRYFREHGLRLPLPNQWELLIKDALKSRRVFLRARSKLERVVRPMRERYGITDALVAKCQKQLLSGRPLDLRRVGLQPIHADNGPRPPA